MHIAVSHPPHCITDDDVRTRTGRDWGQWFALLDRIGAQTLTHEAIARLLNQHYEVEGWYVQSIATEYMRARRKA